MKTTTKQAKQKFESITGIKIKSIREETGSMKEFYRIRIKADLIIDFINSWYDRDKTLSYIKVTFLSSEFKGYRDLSIKKSELNI